MSKLNVPAEHLEKNIEKGKLLFTPQKDEITFPEKTFRIFPSNFKKLKKQ